MRRIFLFGFVGGMATLVHFVVATAVFRGLGLSIFLGNIAGYAIAFFVSYFGHYHLTFESREHHGAALRKFAFTAGAGFVVNNAVLAAMTLALGRESLVSLAIAIVAAAVAVYVLSRYWAFATSS